MKKHRMRPLKFVLSLLLATTITLGMFPAALAAEEQNEYTQNMEYNTTEFKEHNFFDTNQLDMWYDEPTYDDGTIKGGQNWQKQTMPLGNGYMGALIYGGIKNEQLTLNEKTLWQGGPGTKQEGETDAEIFGNFEKTKAGLEQLRKEIAESPNKEVSTSRAQQLLTNSSSALFREKHGSYQTFCDMNITMEHSEEASDYIRGLDLDTATSVVEYTVDGVKYQREYFMSYPDNVLVARITADQPGMVSLDLSLTGRQPTGSAVTADAATQTITLAGTLEDWQHNENPGVTLHGNGMKYGGQAALLNEGGIVSASDSALRVTGADSVIILFTSGTDYVQEYPTYKGEDPHKKVTDTLTAAQAETFEQLRQTHRDDYTSLYNRVKLELGQEKPVVTTDVLLSEYPNGDAATERYMEKLVFDFGRFLLISSSRAGSLPANLQGVWNALVSPQWESDYHLNINMQMNYWMTDVLNMPELLAPVDDYMEDVAKAGTVTAETLYGFDDGSWIMHNPMNPFGHTGLQFYAAGFWFPESSAWILRQNIEHYDFTRDQQYLQETLYPLVEGNVKFWLNYLVEDPFDPSVLICNPTCLPEQAPFTPAGSMSQQIVYDFLENYIMISEAYEGEHPNPELLEKVREILPKVDRGLRVDEELGIIRDWKYKASQSGSNFRHLNQVYALYPSNDLLFEESTDSDLLKAAETFLEMRKPSGITWSLAWRAALQARLGQGDLALEALEKAVADTYAPNLFSISSLFQIDGNLGYSAAVAEMLLQSHAGYIDVLPALPTAWSAGSFTDFVARGNFLVDVTWADSAYETIHITSRSGGTLSIKLEDMASATVTRNGEPVRFTEHPSIDGVYNLETNANDEIVISRNQGVKAAPTGVQAQRDLEGNVSMTWNEVPGASGYTVMRYEGGIYTKMIETSTTSASFTDASIFVGEGKDKNTSTQYVVAAKVNGTDSLYSAYTMPDTVIPPTPAELIGYWSFDDDSDRGANNVEGAEKAIIGENITFEPGKSGDAAVLTGENGSDVSTIIAPITLVPNGKDIVNTDFSISLWIKNTATTLPSGQTQAVVAQLVELDNLYATGGTTKPPLLINYPNGLRYGTSMTGQTEFLTAQNTVGEWTHLVVVSDTAAKTLTLYVNGQQAGQQTDYTPTSETGPLGLMFGQHRNRLWGFKGMMDEICCYTGVLSDEQIKEIYDNNGIPPKESIDKSALESLYQGNAGKTEDVYTTGSWASFQTAMENAKAVLDNADATQTEVNEAAAALQSAVDGLVNISTLEYVLGIANGHVEAGDVDKLVPSAQEVFNKVLASAQAIYDDPNATQEQVDTAWETLMYAIQAMGFVPGDKTELIDLVAEAKALDLNAYEDGAEKDAFTTALKAAEDLIADPDAMELDINAAYDTLSDAMQNLIPKPAAGDKTELKKVIDEADIKNSELDRYVDDAEAKQKFADALAAAKEVYEKDGATQEEIDQAKFDLIDAMTGLRLRADKENLEQWLEDLKSIDLSQYTEESAAVVRAVIAKAEALAAQDLDENDQDLINAMVAEMAIAKAQLVPASTDPEAPENPNPGDGSGSGESSNPDTSKPNGDGSSQNGTNSEGKEATDKVPTTGDNAPVTAMFLLVAAAMGAWLTNKKYNRK